MFSLLAGQPHLRRSRGGEHLSSCKINYDDIKTSLRTYANEDTARFSQKIIPDLGMCYGLKTKDVINIFNTFIKCDPEGFLLFPVCDSHEEMLLWALAVCSLRCDEQARWEYARKYVSNIRNWAQCDFFCSRYPVKKCSRQQIWELIAPCFKSDKQFDVRFAVVMARRHFLTPEFIKCVMDEYVRIRSEYYYVKMSVAWGVADMYIIDKKIVLEALEGNELEKWTRNKAIQKICESRRVSQAEKEQLRQYKIK